MQGYVSTEVPDTELEQYCFEDSISDFNWSKKFLTVEFTVPIFSSLWYQLGAIGTASGWASLST